MKPRPISKSRSDERTDRWVPSVCGLCSVGCGLEIGVSESGITGVRGRAEHPVARGRLGPKGLNQWYANRHPARLKHPMRRDARGRLVRCSWNDALDLLAEKITDAIARHGPDAVAIYGSGQLLLEEYYTLGKIARGGLGIANIDANTRLCTATTASSLMENFGADGPPGTFADIEETECLVLVGHNAAEQSTTLWMRMLAAKDGPRHPKVIVIDPRRTLTVETGADLHLALKPGTNVALLNGICRLLIENGWIDRAFLDAHVLEFDRFAKIVSTYTPERVEEICGVPAQDLRTAAEWIGRSASTVTTCLQGVYQSNQATAAACTVNSMHLLMGKVGKRGSAPFQFAGQPSSMNTRETGADGTYPAYRNWEDPDHMRDLAKRWNVRFELLGKQPVSTPEIFELVEEGHVRVLWNIGTNPAVSMTDRGAQLRGLERVFLVVQDGFNDTETSALADLLLPAAIWGEKEGCMTNAERRCQLLAKVVDPPGEARSDLAIFLDVARRLRLEDASGEPLIGYVDARGAFEEWKEISKGCICDYSGMTYESLRPNGLQWPCDAEHPAGTERLYTDSRFPTGWREAESYRKALDTGREHTLEEYREKKDADGKAVLIGAEYEPPLEAPDDEFPFAALTGRLASHWHTRTKTARAPELNGAAPEAFVGIHESDAAAAGLADGDLVRVESRRGSVVAPVKIGGVVPRGAVFVPFHFGDLRGEGAANELTPKAWDPVSKQPVQKSAAVRIRPAGRREDS